MPLASLVVRLKLLVQGYMDAEPEHRNSHLESPNSEWKLLQSFCVLGSTKPLFAAWGCCKVD